MSFVAAAAAPTAPLPPLVYVDPTVEATQYVTALRSLINANPAAFTPDLRAAVAEMNTNLNGPPPPPQ